MRLTEDGCGLGDEGVAEEEETTPGQHKSLSWTLFSSCTDTPHELGCTRTCTSHPAAPGCRKLYFLHREREKILLKG